MVQRQRWRLSVAPNPIAIMGDWARNAAQPFTSMRRNIALPLLDRLGVRACVRIVTSDATEELGLPHCQCAALGRPCTEARV
jgi:hypothetical protein